MNIRKIETIGKGKIEEEDFFIELHFPQMKPRKVETIGKGQIEEEDFLLSYISYTKEKWSSDK